MKVIIPATDLLEKPQPVALFKKGYNIVCKRVVFHQGNFTVEYDYEKISLKNKFLNFIKRLFK